MSTNPFQEPQLTDEGRIERQMIVRGVHATGRQLLQENRKFREALEWYATGRQDNGAFAKAVLKIK
jgi:hypothetical protein